MPTKIYFTSGEAVAVRDDVDATNDLLAVTGGTRIRIELINGTIAYIDPGAVTHLASFTPQRAQHMAADLGSGPMPLS